MIDVYLWNKLMRDSTYLDDFGPSTRRRVKFIVGTIGRGRVLNVGSGQGYIEKAVPISKLSNWTSLDISLTGLKRIRNMLKIKCVLGSITKLPFNDNVFDYVICSEVIEHLPLAEISHSYSELKRVAKECGNIIISMPVYEPAVLKNHPVGHKRKMTPLLIEKELENNGLSVSKRKKIYAFNKYGGLLSLISKYFKVRRPSVYMCVCKKK